MLGHSFPTRRSSDLVPPSSRAFLEMAIAGALAGLDELSGAKWVDGAGHWVQQERSDEVNRILLAFLRDVEQP